MGKSDTRVCGAPSCAPVGHGRTHAPVGHGIDRAGDTWWGIGDTPGDVDCGGTIGVADHCGDSAPGATGLGPTLLW